MDTALRLHWIRRVAVVLVVMTFAIMVVGSWVKATGSGLACPDWPACYGQWLPPFPSAENGGVDPANGEPVVYSQAQILYEWAHRALVSLFVIPFAALLVLTLRGEGLNPWLHRLPLLAGMVLVVQILLGGGTVLKGNPPGLTTAHLATATVVFFLVTATAFTAFLRPLADETAPPAPTRRRDAAPAVLFPGEES